MCGSLDKGPLACWKLLDAVGFPRWMPVGHGAHTLQIMATHPNTGATSINIFKCHSRYSWAEKGEVLPESASGVRVFLSSPKSRDIAEEDAIIIDVAVQGQEHHIPVQRLEIHSNAHLIFDYHASLGDVTTACWRRGSASPIKLEMLSAWSISWRRSLPSSTPSLSLSSSPHQRR